MRQTDKNKAKDPRGFSKAFRQGQVRTIRRPIDSMMKKRTLTRNVSLKCCVALAVILLQGCSPEQSGSGHQIASQDTVTVEILGVYDKELRLRLKNHTDNVIVLPNDSLDYNIYAGTRLTDLKIVANNSAAYDRNLRTLLQTLHLPKRSTLEFSIDTDRSLEPYFKQGLLFQVRVEGNAYGGSNISREERKHEFLRGTSHRSGAERSSRRCIGHDGTQARSDRAHPAEGAPNGD